MSSQPVDQLADVCVEWASAALGESLDAREVERAVHDWLFGRAALWDGLAMGVVTKQEAAAAIAGRFGTWLGDMLGRYVELTGPGDDALTDRLTVALASLPQSTTTA